MSNKLFNNTEMTNMGMKRFLHESLKFLANLACSDGALILTSNFEIVGFGATLQSPPWNGNVLVGPDGFGHEGGNFHIKKYGTRHNSMVDYIGEKNDCFGFVFSHDGPIRGFYKVDKNTVYCWPDCSVSMFEF
jgi:DNA integrity scanning protein DisA with diadenylate cyclase activity